MKGVIRLSGNLARKGAVPVELCPHAYLIPIAPLRAVVNGEDLSRREGDKNADNDG